MRLSLVLAMGMLILVSGCDNGVKTQDIPIKGGATNALDEAKSLLKNYAEGQPITSEAASFPKMIEDVKAIDATKGAILEKGLENLQKSKGNLKNAAKELLSKL